MAGSAQALALNRYVRQNKVAAVKQAIIYSECDVPWVALAPGVEMQIYHADETTGCWSAKVHMYPGSTLPPHRHIGASEFYVLQGEGNHPQSGDFKPGDYAFETEGAVHTAVYAENDIFLYMVSYGASEFIKPDGAVLYHSDAAYFKNKMGNGVLDVLSRKIKYFFFIYLWKKMKGRG